jgi:hypothetical protein
MWQSGTNIGIGTTTPTDSLQIAGGNLKLDNASGGTAGNFFLGGRTFAGQPGMRLFGGMVNGTLPASFIDVMSSNVNDGLRFRVDNTVGGTERMRITAAGNVGIGTTNPQSTLDLFNPGQLHVRLNAGTTTYVDLLRNSNTQWQWGLDDHFGTAGFFIYDNVGGNYRFGINASTGNLLLQATSGNVGIGTSTPGSKLDVVGNINFSGGLSYQGSTVLTFPPGLLGACCNVGLGVATLQHNTTGSSNTAVGTSTLNGNTTGSANTGIGERALTANTTGSSNTAIGYFALQANQTSSSNTAVGLGALGSATLGPNTAVGYLALNSVAPQEGGNPIGNTAVGYQALSHDGAGGFNTAVGDSTLSTGTLPNNNTAVGYQALMANSGFRNVAVGDYTLSLNTSGYWNTAVGSLALSANTSGYYNVGIGYNALAANTGGSNTAVGSNALWDSTGSSNIAIGFNAGQNVTSGSNNIEIGNNGNSLDNGTILIGTPGTQTSFFAAGIYGVNSNGIPVYINSNGQLGTISSSRRYKEDIRDMADASNGLMRLRPVTFHYQKPFPDATKPLQYGLIAEEVAEVYPDLVAHSADGQIETVKYQVLDSMLLNEVQRLNRENQALQDRLSKLEAAVERMTAVAGH